MDASTLLLEELVETTESGGMPETDMSSDTDESDLGVLNVGERSLSEPLE